MRVCLTETGSSEEAAIHEGQDEAEQYTVPEQRCAPSRLGRHVAAAAPSDSVAAASFRCYCSSQNAVSVTWHPHEVGPVDS